MCGIAGFDKEDISTIPPHRLHKLLTALEERGHDAAGFSYKPHDESISVIKGKYTASKFLKIRKVKKELAKAGKAKWGLFHTRAATNGTPSNNKNNHPIWSDKGMIIHNGIVWSTEKVKTQGETDSEKLLVLIDKLGLEEAIKRISGWLAFAYVSLDEPDVFYLYHCGAPIVWAQENGIFFFASTAEILKKAFPVKAVQALPANCLYKVKNGKISLVSLVHPKASFALKYPYVYTMSGISDGNWSWARKDEDYSGTKKKERKIVRRKERQEKNYLMTAYREDLIYGSSGKPIALLE